MRGFQIYKILGGSLSLFLLMSNTSYADSNLNCDAYATLTVKQAKEAKQRGVDLAGRFGH